MKASWDNTKAVKDNLDAMGLAYDPNKVIKNKSVKSKMVEKLKESRAELKTENGQVESTPVSPAPVVQQLEKEIASMPRKNSFRFPPEQVKFITFMMDKYGEDYKVSD